jgi:hypothetical protein
MPRVLLVLVMTTAVLAADRGGAQWMAQRAQARKDRAALREQAANAAAQRAKENVERITTLIKVAGETKAPGSKAECVRMVAALKRLDATAAEALQPKVDALADAAESEVSPADKSRWKQYLADTRAALVKKPGELLNRTVMLGVVDLTYDFLREVLAFDPDQPSIRKTLGQVKVGNDYVSKFVATQLSAGLMWDSKLGWMIAKQKSRYDAGEYYELAAKKWGKLSDLTTLHQNPQTPWVVQTHHFEVRGTCKLETVVEAAEKLEAFYAQIFAVYASFFAKGGPADYKVILGLTDHPRLVVNIFRSRDQYRAAMPESPDWSGGVFAPGKNASFFYNNEDTGKPINITRVLYHEITHQILHTFSTGNHSPSWLTEGIAVYTEAAEVVDGELVVGRKPPRAKSKLPLMELLAVDSGDKWSKTPQYAAAGTLVYFCMEGDGRKYREDFVDYLRDNYRGTTAGKKLWDYLGLPQADFEKAYAAFQGGGA